MSAQASNTNSDAWDGQYATKWLCRCSKAARKCKDCDEIHPGSLRQQERSSTHKKARGSRSRKPPCVVNKVAGLSSWRKQFSGSCLQPRHGQRHPPPPEMSTFADPELIESGTPGHIFENTYLTDNAVAIQGNVYNTSKSKYITYGVHEKRSSFEVVVAGLFGVAVGVPIGGYVMGSAMNYTSKNSEHEYIERAGYTASLLTGWTPVPESIFVRRGMLCSPTIFDNTVSNCASSTYRHGTEIIRQVNMAERVPIARQICSAERKVIQQSPPRQKILVLTANKTCDARYRFLLRELKTHNDTTVTNSPAEVISRLRETQRCPEAIVIYDKSSLTCAMDCPLLRADMIRCLDDFTRSGGTTILGPECDIFDGELPIIELLSNIWRLQIKPRASLRHTQFIVSPSIANVVGRALSYYYRDVAGQLAHMDKLGGTIPGIFSPEKDVLCKIIGPRCRSTSENSIMFIQHGKGKLGALGKLGSKLDTSRMVCAMIEMRDEQTVKPQ